jgi:hypothetical protein
MASGMLSPAPHVGLNRAGRQRHPRSGPRQPGSDLRESLLGSTRRRCPGWSGCERLYRGATYWETRALVIGNNLSAAPLVRGQIEAIARQIIDCGPTATATATAIATATAMAMATASASVEQRGSLTRNSHSGPRERIRQLISARPNQRRDLRAAGCLTAGSREKRARNNPHRGHGRRGGKKHAMQVGDAVEFCFCRILSCRR